tara:strand:+ start:152 stop:268 length:117 start_codon:yes stop_codon:yes gene_type:complete
MQGYESGATAEIVTQEIPELNIADAQGITNNISRRFLY